MKRTPPESLPAAPSAGLQPLPTRPDRGRVPWVVMALAGLASGIAALFLSRPAPDDEHLLNALGEVWPQVSAMAPEDRALLASLARHCAMSLHPKSLALASACLREAAVQPHLGGPESGGDPASRLERLLASATVR